MRELFDLFISFAKIGVITFGGGYAMLPNIRDEIVNKRKWATDDEVLDYYAIGQCTPGVIAVNTATFIGHKRRGNLGAVAATLGIIFPSLIIIMIIAGVIKNFSDIIWIEYAFSGIRIAVCALILSTITDMFKKGVKDFVGVAIFAVGSILALFFDISPIVVIVLAILAGLVASTVRRDKQ